MERYLKAQDLLSQFELGLNPLPDVEQDAPILVRQSGADRARLETYLDLYGIRIDRKEARLFADGSDQVYVLTWPGPLFQSHWKQRITMTEVRRKRRGRR
jgi:hypothetical protein